MLVDLLTMLEDFFCESCVQASTSLFIDQMIDEAGMLIYKAVVHW